MWSRPRQTRSCSECGQQVEVERRDADRRHVYCSSGCKANGWRLVHGLPPVPEWIGAEVQPTPVEMMQRSPTG